MPCRPGIFRRLCCRLLLAAGLAGCASPTITVRVPLVQRLDVRPLQGDTRRINLELSARAEAYAQRLGNASAWRGEGLSMHPLIEPDSWVVVQRRPFADLQPGDVVFYTNDEGRHIVHALIQTTDAGWIVEGVNNGGIDAERVTAANYAGVVVAAFTPVNGPVR